MNNITILFGFNNYYNRIIKGSDNYDFYLQNSGGHIKRDNINFINNDGITTTQVMNYESLYKPNYLLVTINNGEEEVIVSRWFILSSTENRKGQYTLQLRRDVIYDNYEKVLKAPCFIEKANININSPYIYNKEEAEFNQIKQSENLLRDYTQCAWIVGYMAKSDKTALQNAEVSYKTDPAETYSSLGEFLSSYRYRSYINTNKRVTSIVNSSMTFAVLTGTTSDVVKEVFNDRTLNIIATGYSAYDSFNGYKSKRNTYSGEDNTASIIAILNHRLEDDSSIIKTTYGNDGSNEVANENGKIIKIGSSYYIIRVHISGADEVVTHSITSNDGSLYTYMKNDLDSLTWLVKSNNLHYNIRTTTTTYRITYELVNAYFGTAKFDISYYPQDTIQILNDAPYTMFAIPYLEDIQDDESGIVEKFNKLRLRTSSGTSTIEFSKETAIAIANSIALTLSTGVYDLQLLPYCPLKEFNIIENPITLDASNVPNYKQMIVKDDTKIVGAVFFATSSSFKNRIFVDIPVNNYNSSIEFKVDRETTLYRLTSPNFANFEQFDPWMNKGVDYVEAECTYKPFNPYIHLSINYKGMYGKDFDDARGLICGGDYSLPMMTDAWKTYQIQNKNYATIFDRQQQHTIKTYNIGVENMTASAILNIGAGAVGGAITGNAGGAALGAIGGIARTGISAYTNYQSVKENLQYAQDMYEMNLQNIQAIPQGLAKSSGFNFNNKLFPFIEKYIATDEEKNAFRNKLNYEGMKVNAISNILSFQKEERTFIKGRIIRLESFTDDEIANEIFNEVAKGLYI